MSSITLDSTVFPPEDESVLALLRQLHTLLSGQGPDQGSTPDRFESRQIVVPAALLPALRDMVEMMLAGQAVHITPVQQRLTTQEAAELLGVSRPTLVKLLERGEIPFEQPGSHRRVLLADVLAYRERDAAERRASLDRMIELGEASGMYERATTPKRTR